MLNFNHKKCFCKITDCGKCLTLGCTDDSCGSHRIITKWRYREHLLDSLIDKVEKLRDNKSKKELAALRRDIKICEEEVKRLDGAMSIKQ